MIILNKYQFAHMFLDAIKNFLKIIYGHKNTWLFKNELSRSLASYNCLSICVLSESRILRT